MRDGASGIGIYLSFHEPTACVAQTRSLVLVGLCEA